MLGLYPPRLKKMLEIVSFSSHTGVQSNSTLFIAAGCSAVDSEHIMYRFIPPSLILSVQGPSLCALCALRSPPSNTCPDSQRTNCKATFVPLLIALLDGTAEQHVQFNIIRSVRCASSHTHTVKLHVIRKHEPSYVFQR